MTFVLLLNESLWVFGGFRFTTLAADYENAGFRATFPLICHQAVAFSCKKAKLKHSRAVPV